MHRFHLAKCRGSLIISSTRRILAGPNPLTQSSPARDAPVLIPPTRQSATLLVFFFPGASFWAFNKLKGHIGRWPRSSKPATHDFSSTQRVRLTIW